MAQKNSEGIIPITADTKDVKSLIHVIRGNSMRKRKYLCEKE